MLSGLTVRLSPPIARLRMLPGLDVLDEPDWDRKLDRMVEAVDGRRLGALGGIPSSILDFLRRAEARLPHDAFRRAVGGVELALSSGVAFSRYRDEIEALLGHDIDVAELYTATEGAYGIQVEPGRPVFELLAERLFFEFVPESQWDAGRCDASLLLHELEVGKRYVPLVTNGSGAFRYPIGDRICCHSAGSAPHIELAGRLSLTLNLAGEKTSAEVVHAVAKELAREAGAELTQFTVTGRSEGERPCYEWVLPAEADWNDRSEKELAEHVDALTARHHDRYRAHRAQRLGPPRVHLVATERLERWAARQSADAGHRKVPPIVENPDQLAELLDEG